MTVLLTVETCRRVVLSYWQLVKNVYLEFFSLLVFVSMHFVVFAVETLRIRRSRKKFSNRKWLLLALPFFPSRCFSAYYYHFISDKNRTKCIYAQENKKKKKRKHGLRLDYYFYYSPRIQQWKSQKYYHSLSCCRSLFLLHIYAFAICYRLSRWESNDVDEII